jgi:DNA-directed RNA polymerase specialized sigma24 family protein
MPPDEALALAALRRWCQDRRALHAAKTADYVYAGCENRRLSRFDARLVRTIDFARALATLDPREQVALIYRHRDHEDANTTARAIGCSPRTVGNLLLSGRRNLAAILMARDLL